MKPRTQRQKLLSPVAPKTERPFSPARAFVVQFRDEMDATRGRCCGRVEHIVSGHATRFSSFAELRAFFSRILTAVRDEKGVRL